LRQLADPKIQELVNGLEYEDSEKFALVNELVYKKDCGNLKFVIPESMILRVLRIYHDDAVHCGREKTYQRLNHTYWFPSMRKRIYNYIENCFTCIMANNVKNRFEGESTLYPAPNTIMEILHLDHFGPLTETRDHFRYILVVVDTFTRFTWLCPVKAPSTGEVIESLKNIFATFGNPSNIVSDRGTAFTSQEFERFLKELQIKHRKVAVASPWNGQRNGREGKSFHKKFSNKAVIHRRNGKINSPRYNTSLIILTMLQSRHRRPNSCSVMNREDMQILTSLN